MDFIEHAGKAVLAAVGIATPDGAIATTADEARKIAQGLGPVVVKAQVPTGKRGKAGGIATARTPEEAGTEAARILAMTIADWPVECVLVEAAVAIAREMYSAVLNDAANKGPLILFSPRGGMDIEAIADADPGELMRFGVDIRQGISRPALLAALPPVDGVAPDALADLLENLYAAYRANDAELLEINPLALLDDGRLMALDCKFTMDDSAVARHPERAAEGTPERLTPLERRARAENLNYIELDGDVAILANGAGLTMTTMDCVRHSGGRPANFLEIGGAAYTLARPALELALANRNVKSLVVNFCGAFARCDVMTEGILEAWRELAPDVPVFFSIHGTGEDEAVAMVREQLGLEPFERMDDAVAAAVEAARGPEVRQ